MADPNDMEKLLQRFSTALPLDVTPPVVEECVVVEFEDGTVDCIPVSELERA
ncbi:MAG TPA: hypothetical protein VI935_01125 [Thermodesulfobacteriota bacterium]|nr:hypothetical protein [Thermodesulfobacteriota bacterium]